MLSEPIGTSVELPELNVGRVDHGIAASASGDVVVAGGRTCVADGEGALLDAVERLSDGATAWVELAPLPAAVTRPALVFADGGQLLLIGGENAGDGSDSVLAYDDELDAWSELGSLPAPAGSPLVARLAGGELVIVGNADRIAAVPSVSNDGGASWSEMAAPAGLGTETSLVSLPDGRLGVVSSHYSQGVFLIYDPSADTWEPVPVDPSAMDWWIGAAGLVEGATVAVLREEAVEGQLSACARPFIVDVAAGEMEPAPCCSRGIHTAGKAVGAEGFGASSGYAVLRSDLGDAVFVQGLGWGSFEAGFPTSAAAVAVPGGRFVIAGGESGVDGCERSYQAHGWEP